MAVVNAYVNTDRAAGKLQDYLPSGGGKIITVKQSFESAAGDSDGSVYGVFDMPSNSIPLAGGTVRHDSITGGTGFTYGLYEYVDGVLVDVDENLFKASTTHANTTVNDPFELAMTVGNDGLKLWELLGLTEDPHKTYVWCITGGTVGDGGTFNVTAQFLI